jgi:hypothetical protein
MTTVPSASPRPSLSLVRSPPSSRTSLDQSQTPSQSPSLSRTAIPNARRNRAALRDYYNLKNAAGSVDDASSVSGSRSSSIDPSSRLTDSRNGGHHQASASASAFGSQVPESRLEALDRDGFDAGAHVRQLLETESLKELLRTENALVGEVRGLDGERKALVYDNYSKLIDAMDTIRRMRSNMDPLAPSTSTLAPAISHIAETAAGLADELNNANANAGPLERNGEDAKRTRQAAIVQWALDAPSRLKTLVDQGKIEEAEEEKQKVEMLLHQWSGVSGVEELQRQCAEAVGSSSDSEED